MGVDLSAEKDFRRAHIEVFRDFSICDSLNDIVVFPFYKMSITVRDDMESTPSRHLALTVTLAWAKVVLSGEGRNQNKDISRRFLETHHPRSTQYSDTPGILVSNIIEIRPLGRAMYGRGRHLTVEGTSTVTSPLASDLLFFGVIIIRSQTHR
jgi:hypothetical protein